MRVTEPRDLGSEVLTGFVVLPGNHIRKETPVPIPNTVVKLSEPMIVLTLRK